MAESFGKPNPLIVDPAGGKLLTQSVAGLAGFTQGRFNPRVNPGLNRPGQNCFPRGKLDKWVKLKKIC